MAVKLIRKISSWAFLAIILISILVMGLFYFGGDGEPYGIDEAWNPLFLDHLLVWLYLLFAICAISMLVFGITQFATRFKTNAKKSIITLGFFVGLIVLLIVTFTIGNDTPFPMSMINEDTREYNVEFWLKVIDMWIYSAYVLIAIAVGVIVWGSLRMSLSK